MDMIKNRMETHIEEMRFDKMFQGVIMRFVRHFREGGTYMLIVDFRTSSMMMCMCAQGSSPDLAGA